MVGKCSAKVTFEIIIYNTDMFEEIKIWLFKQGQLQKKRRPECQHDRH